MRITDEPIQDVKKFGNKVAKTACQISGTSSAPIDLYTLVSTAFIDCEVLAFYMKATGLHDLVYSNHNALYADEIIRTLKTKFWSLMDQGMWSPSEGKKLDTGVDLVELKLAMNKLVESQKRY